MFASRWSSELYQNTSTYFGDLSAIIIDNLPFWAELGSTPSQRVSLMSEWESKMEAIINETLEKKLPVWQGFLRCWYCYKCGEKNKKIHHY